MKKTIAVMCICGSLLCSLASCNQDPAGDPTETSAGISQQVESETTVSTKEETPVSDFRYEVNENEGITITRYTGNDIHVVIPATIEGKPVTKIGQWAFREVGIVSVKMPDLVTEIVGEAFMDCTKLTEIQLSNTLYRIGSYTFEGCTSLKHIRIPSSVRVLGELMFRQSGLETIEIEVGIEEIPDNAFAESSLVELTLPDSVKRIGSQAFGACNLESVTLNEGLITIEHKAFATNPNLKEIIIPKTVETVTDLVFSMCTGLEAVKFKGNAPSTFKYSNSVSGVWDPYEVHFTVYYHQDAEGFTAPEWYGYPTQIW